MFKYPLSQLYDIPEQPKLLPGRRPIIQIAERPSQPETRPKVSTPESFIIPESSGHHDKVVPVPDYTIPQTMSEHDSICRTIKRKEGKSQLMLIQIILSCKTITTENQLKL